MILGVEVVPAASQEDTIAKGAVFRTVDLRSVSVLPHCI
jgi:hypothetical protein